MKTITLFLTLVAATLATSKAKASQLYLRTTTPSQTNLKIGPYMYYSQDGYFQVNQIPAGQHFMMVTQQYRGRGRGHRHRELNHRGRDQVLYQGNIYIPPQTAVYASINPWGQLIIERMVQLRPPRTQPPRRGYRNYRSPSQDYRSDAFGALLQLMERESFESSKLALAQQYVRNNHVSSQQVAQMMRALDFESSRLKLAKEAYDYVYDPENFFVVNQAFDFSSSVTALEKHIRP